VKGENVARRGRENKKDAVQKTGFKTCLATVTSAVDSGHEGREAEGKKKEGYSSFLHLGGSWTAESKHKWKEGIFF